MTKISAQQTQLLCSFKHICGILIDDEFRKGVWTWKATEVDFMGLSKWTNSKRGTSNQVDSFLQKNWISWITNGTFIYQKYSKETRKFNLWRRIIIKHSKSNFHTYCEAVYAFQIQTLKNACKCLLIITFEK